MDDWINFLSNWVLNKGNLAQVHSGNTNLRPDGAIIVKYFTSPETFDAFRFALLVEQGGQDVRHGLSHPEKGFLSSRMGEHAWQNMMTL